MKNTAKLDFEGILGAIRLRVGANDENDPSHDTRINEMSNYQLVHEWCAWEIGDGGWWDTMKHFFDSFEELDKLNPLK
jgi:hypothetical protein